MSVGKSEEEGLRAREFERLLDTETAYVDNLMKPPEIEPKMKYMSIMNKKELDETGTLLIKKTGDLLLRFNSLSQHYKIGLFDKLMKYVEKFRKLLEKYGKKIGVASFSINVGFPWGVSISLTFEVK